MTTVDVDEHCTRCGQEILTQLDMKTGKYDKVSLCFCDVKEKNLKKEISILKDNLKLKEEYIEYLRTIIDKANITYRFQPSDLLNDNQIKRLEKLEFKLGYSDYNPEEEK